MALNGQHGIGIVLRGEDQVSAPARKAGSSIKRLGGDVQSASSGMDSSLRLAAAGAVVFFGGLKALKGMFGLAKEAGEFTQEMAAVKAIMGASAVEFKKLEEAAVKGGLATQFSPKEAALALRTLGQAGLKGKDAMAALVPSLDLAAVSLGKLSPARATGAVNAALKTFGLRADEARKAVDLMVFSTNNFNISVDQLPIAIGNVSRGAIALGQDMGDTMILLGLVKNVLPEISSAATLTSSAMLRIADGKTQKKLKKMGVQYTDAAGNFLPALQIFMNIDKSLQSMFKTTEKRAAKITDLLGKRAISPFMAVVQQMRKGVASLPDGFNKGNVAFKVLQLRAKAAQGDMKAVAALARMGLPKAFLDGARNAAKIGASKAFAKTLLNTFTGELTLLKGAFSTFLISIGAPLAEVFRPMLRGLFAAFTAISKFVLSLSSPLKQAIATFAVLSAVVGTVVGAVLVIKAALASTLLIPVIAGISGIAAAISSVALPIMAVIAGIALLRLAWESDFLGLASTTKNFFAAFSEGFMLVAGPAIEGMKIAFKDLWVVFREAGALIKQIFSELGFSSTEMSDGFRLMATFVGAMFGSILKIISFTVVKTLQFWRLLIAIGNWIGGGFKKFELPKSISISGEDKKRQEIKPGQISGGMGQVASGGGFFPRFEKGPNVGRFAAQPQTANVQPGTLPAGAQTTTVVVNGTVNLDGQKMGQIIFEKVQDKKQAGFRRTANQN